MPRYFFDFHEGVVIKDEIGHELPELGTAITQAIKTLPAVAAELIPKRDGRQNFTIIVRDEHGRPLYTASMSFCGTHPPRAALLGRSDRLRS